MSMTDPIADMLTRVRNASRNGAGVVVMPSSKLKVAIADALKREGFVENYSVAQAPGSSSAIQQLTIVLRYGPDGERVFQFLDRVSKPGCRIYAGSDALPRVLRGLGCSILSTSKGILSDRECRRDRVGGEVLCRVG